MLHTLSINNEELTQTYILTGIHPPQTTLVASRE